MVCGNITCLHDKASQTGRLEKETLTEKEQMTVYKWWRSWRLCMKSSFNKYHCAILDQIEDNKKLSEEQAVLDDHEDKVEVMKNVLMTW